jgi:hypothetical protein
MASFPNKIVDSNIKSTVNDVPGNSSVMNASDHNSHDEEIRAIQDDHGVSDSTDLTTLRGRAGGTSRAMVGFDNSMISRSVGLSTNGTDTVTVGLTSMFIDGIYQANIANTDITGMTSNGFYILYAQRLNDSTSTIPTLGFQTGTMAGATPTESEVKTVLDLVKDQITNGPLCLLGETTRVGGTIAAPTDYALDGLYDSGWTDEPESAVTLAVATDFTVTHNLGHLPSKIEIWHSATSDGIDATLVSGVTYNGSGFFGSSILTSRRNTFVLRTGDTSVVNSLASGGASLNTVTGGYYRIIAMRDSTQIFTPITNSP